MTRFDKLITAVRRFLLEDVAYGSYVGIIAYNTNAYVAADMTEILSEELRKELVDKLPQRVGTIPDSANTATGKGLLKGLEVTHFVHNYYKVYTFQHLNTTPFIPMLYVTPS